MHVTPDASPQQSAAFWQRSPGAAQTAPSWAEPGCDRQVALPSSDAAQ
jgi:hypothetical protein